MTIFKAIGLMSGTSMDGIDACLLETDGKYLINPLEYFSIEYDQSFKLELRKAEELVSIAKSDVTPVETIKKSTLYHANVVSQLLTKARIASSEVNLIGYHGQSLYHNSADGITIQIGDGQLLSNLTKIPVINNFRINDIANGGQGAPLAPIYHQALAVNKNFYPIAFVNCGGISNISIINGSLEADIIGFDTGPGNALIDRYIRIKTNNAEFMDRDGQYGLKGEVNNAVLHELITNFSSYINKPCPKSLDPSELNLIPSIFDLSIFDACATLENYTSYCIANSVSTHLLPSKWILAGGGWKNPVIMKYLHEYLAKKLTNYQIYNADEVGFDNNYMEAELFAYLAVRSFKNLPISFPKVTGVKSPCTGGVLFNPN